MSELDRQIADAIDDEALLQAAVGAPHEFSPAYRAKMERLYRKAATHPRRRCRPLRKIVALAAVVAVLVGSLTAGAFWPELLQFMTQFYGGYAELRTVEPFKTKNTVVPFDGFPEDWTSFWYPERLPGTCVVARTETHYDRKVIIYADNEGKEMLFSQSPGPDVIRPDEEGATTGSYFVGSFKVFVLEKDGGERIFSWTDEVSSFSLMGAFSAKELESTANSLVLIEG